MKCYTGRSHLEWSQEIHYPQMVTLLMITPQPHALQDRSFSLYCSRPTMIEGLRQAKEHDREQRDITNAGKVVAPSVTDILPEKLDKKTLSHGTEDRQ